MLVSEEKRGDKLSDNSSNNFPFIKLPRALIDDPNFSGLSAESKLLFSLILDRMGVSQMNADRFTDKNGNLFVYFTIQEICSKIGCSHGKAVRLINELEYHDLIFKQRKGCGKPNKIIVLPSVLGILKTVHKKSDNENSEVPENRIQQFSKSDFRLFRFRNGSVTEVHQQHLISMLTLIRVQKSASQTLSINSIRSKRKKRTKCQKKCLKKRPFQKQKKTP